ncbi:MAG: aconitase X, partial [Pseudomonadota bacterium]
MKLNEEEQAMRAGAMGPVMAWAIDHQVKVGAMFDAADMVSVSQAHMMADPEAVGEAGVAFLEDLASKGGRVSVPTITDPRGVDL